LKNKQVTPGVRKLQIEQAEKYYSSWESLYKVSQLADYYRGFQWKTADSDYNPYTVNQFYSTVKSKLASYLFANPKFNLSPKPAFFDWDLETAIKSAQLKQDLLEHLINHPKSKFAEEIRRAFIDSLLGFGLLEVGYAADWILNPNTQKPLLKSMTDPNYQPGSKDKDPVVSEPAEVPQDERIYFKRINFRRFRTSTSDAFYLDQLDWYGYWELVYKSDLEAMPGIKLPDNTITSSIFDNLNSSVASSDLSVLERELYASGQLVKVWKIWDNRAREKQLILGSTGDILFSEPITGQDIFDLRLDEDLEGFYPLPPAFQWISPQNEINETREQLRNHRRRFVRKYQALTGTIDEAELVKFETGGDGTVVFVGDMNGIRPIENADLGASVQQSFISSRDDFRIVSGTSAEMQGMADRTTATQASIQEGRASSRENYEQEFIQSWLCKIAARTLAIAELKFTEEVWIQTSVDVSEGLGEEIQEVSSSYKLLSPADIQDGYDYKVAIDVVSLSPLQAEVEKRKFIEFISLLQNFPALGLSPILIREAAYRVGYRNEKVIREMQQAALLSMMAQQSQGQGDATAQRIVAKQTPNTQEQITNQLQGQLMQ
jgi:hypothetical protein